MSGNELGLGSALSEEEGAVSPRSLFVLLLGHKKEHNLEGKNIYCAGCFWGTGSFDVGSFGSCTVGSIKIGGPGGTTLSNVRWERVSGPAGNYDGLIMG